MEGYKIIYDSMTAGIRTIKLEMGGFFINILHNPKMEKDIHVTFEQSDFFGPKIDYIDGRFILTYNYIVIPEDFQDDFKKEYDKALQFCNTVKPVLNAVIKRIRDGESL